MNELQPRSRLQLALLIVLTILLGLGSRRYSASLPDVIGSYAGDTLWAVMMFWIVAWLAPAARTMSIGLVALGISFAIECSQLYHAPWLDSLRSTRVGALALGQGFLWSDLACYAVGVGLAMKWDRAIRKGSTRMAVAP